MPGDCTEVSNKGDNFVDTVSLSMHIPSIIMDNPLVSARGPQQTSCLPVLSAVVGL